MYDMSVGRTDASERFALTETIFVEYAIVIYGCTRCIFVAIFMNYMVVHLSSAKLKPCVMRDAPLQRSGLRLAPELVGIVAWESLKLRKLRA